MENSFMSPSHTRVPARRAIDRFVEAWDAVVVESPDRQNAAVLVLLTAEGATVATHSLLYSLRARLVADNTELAPHALIEPGRAYHEGPLTMLYEDITEDLARTMPAGTGRLTFPSYWLLRDIVAGEEPAESGLGRARAVRRAVYAEHLRRTGRGRLREQLREQASGWAQPVKFLVELWMDWLAEPWYGYRIGHRMLRARNRNWYATWARQLRGTPVRDFFASVQDLAPGGRDADSEVVEQVLLRALLSDLDNALRHRVLSPWRRRRVTRFVLFVEDAGPVDRRPPDAPPGGPEGAHLRRFLAEYLVAAEELRSRSTLVVGCVQREFVAELEVAAQADFEAAAGELRSRMRSRSGPVALAVPVRPEAEVTEWSAGDHRKITPRFFRWGPVAGLTLRCVTVAAVGAALIGGGYFTGALPFTGRCPSGQFGNPYGAGCLGLSDGTGPQRFEGMPEEFDRLFGKIAENNGAVEKNSKGRDAAVVRTVVYFSPMTAGSATDPELGGSLPELRGVALAQHDININEAKNSNKVVQLKVLLANTGPGFKGAERVAEEIVARAEKEDIVGVIGFGQSQPGTYDAMKVFDEASIPMIGTSATADDMQDQSNQYYQLAPTNDREARIMNAFLQKESIILSENGKMSRAKNAIVMSDPKDKYSSNLAKDFTTAFGKSNITSIEYTPSHEGKSLTDQANQVCKKLTDDPETAVVWASRARELKAFLDEYRDTNCDGRVTVLGGDDVTNSLLGDNKSIIANNIGLSLYHVTLALPKLTHTNKASEFVNKYNAYYSTETDNDEMLQDSHSALGWDAMAALSHAIGKSYSDSGDKNFGKSTVAKSLDGDFRGAEVQGVTGIIDFSGESRVPTNKPMYVLHDTEPNSPGTDGKSKYAPVEVLKCGYFGTGTQNLSWWGPGFKYRCPVDSD
ncbi:ABC transporter substrate-binding protein [Streptomyces sp. NPDC101194]|uniref:ABC transporter substrate-binding protein n=1 Tax=Streptomyces sp. NPDC101194 TaxID=3366127 RepID=UPI00382BEDAC